MWGYNLPSCDTSIHHSPKSLQINTLTNKIAGNYRFKCPNTFHPILSLPTIFVGIFIGINYHLLLFEVYSYSKIIILYKLLLPSKK